MISDTIKTLCNNILCVYSKKDKNVYYRGKFEPVLFKHKYSSAPGGSVRLKFNGDIIPVEDMLVKYVCPTCYNEHTIVLKRFLIKNTIKCASCREDKEKRQNQSKFVRRSFAEFGKVIKKDREISTKFKSLSTEDLIDLSINSFDKESDNFRERYFDLVPTEDEFNKIRNKIKIDNVDVSKSKYYPFIKTSHSHKYSPKIMDEFGELHLLYYVKYKCDSCDVEFEGRNLKKRCSDYKILCRECALSNRAFKIRYTENIRNEKVRYQSSPELDLIKYCNFNSILIENGPIVDYEFNGELHRYRVDFRIKNIVIEIKDNHIWHRNEVKSGKWKAKEESAIKYCHKNGLDYRLIMKSDVKALKDDIIRYHWFK